MALKIGDLKWPSKVVGHKCRRMCSTVNNENIVKIHIQKQTSCTKIVILTHKSPFPSDNMGQGLSTAINPPPLTCQHCLVDGVIDVGRYIYYRRRCDDANESIDNRHRSAFKKTKR